MKSVGFFSRAYDTTGDRIDSTGDGLGGGEGLGSGPRDGRAIEPVKRSMWPVVACAMVPVMGSMGPVVGGGTEPVTGPLLARSSAM